jgi:2'-5' RNA ligase
MEQYRLFIAAELPASISDALLATQARLRRAAPPVKWVAPEAMHLTLRFLGETDVQLLPPLGTALRAALAGHSAISLQLTSAGAFPNIRRPSIVWVGVGGATAALEQAVAALEAQVVPLGFPPEQRPFRAHLTLGRVRREATPAQQERLGEAICALPAFPPLAWLIERVVVFRSELRPSGPIYSALDTVTLG